MSLTKEELLRPRYKVIADYPNNTEHTIGEILYADDSGDFWSYSDTGKWREYPDKYPHLFQPLQWWQERDIKDMPEYVKHSNGEYYRHKYQFEKELYFDQECAGHWIGWTEVDKDFNNYTPVSKEEYTPSKQAK